MLKKILKTSSFFVLYGVLINVSLVKADFLRMPEIEELRSIKEKTLLRDMDVPPVRDRSPDPTAGPRLAVAEFRIQGLVEFPELGITHDAIYKLVESIRFDLMGEGKLLESGYTINELSEVSDLLIDIEEETVDRHVTSLEVQKLIWLIRSQQGKRGVTLGQIEAVADSITQFYRQRGFILAKAYIPKQEVRDGIVNLTVLLGLLGEVNVLGNDLYDAEDLKSVFKGDIDKPVTHEVIEENLYLINGFPGITVDGYFEPGTQVGDTKLNVNVRNEEQFSFYTRFDNHGSEDSGLYRFLLGGQANNIFGNADYFSVSLLQTVFPEDTTYWQLNYETNLFNPRVRLAMDISQNQFLVDQSSEVGTVDADLGGLVTVYGVQANYIVQKSLKQNSSYQLRYEHIDSDLEIGGSDFGGALDAELEKISVSYKFDLLDDKNKIIHDANFTYDYGRFISGFATGQDEIFHIFSVDYTLLTFMKVPVFDINSRVVLNSFSQYSGTSLSSTARFSLSGPTKVRGFSPGYFTADDATYLGVQWILDSPKIFDFSVKGVKYSNVFKPILFVDYAYGHRYTLTAGDEDATAHLADVGLGIQITNISGVSSNIQVAFPVLSQLELETTEPEYDSVRLNFDFQYSF